MIVAIEGIDAAGKNEQVKRLVEWFTKHDSLQFGNVRQHDFPHYETVAGGVVGRILRGQTIIIDANDVERDDGSAVSYAAKWNRDKGIIVQSVMVADRLEWLPLLVEFAQSVDNLLLLDRYKMSGIAYGAAEGVEATFTRTIQSSLPDADLNVLLDISVDESYRRRPQRRDHNERDLDKLHRARGFYLREFNQIAASDADSCLVVDGNQDADSIKEQIVEAILRKIESLYREQNMTIEFEKH